MTDNISRIITRDDLDALPAHNLLERFTIWLLKLPYEPEERLLRFEQARKLKLDNDARERKLAAQQEMRVIAVWNCSAQLTATKEAVTFIVHLCENDTQRGWKIQCCKTKTGGIRSTGDIGSIDQFLKATDTYIKVILPWMQSSITTDQMRKRAECTFYEITVVA